MHTLLPAFLTAVVLSLPLSAAAQQPPTIPIARDAQLLLNYDSVFSQYRPYQDEAIAEWRAANDEVARVGGHIGIFRGAGQASHGHEKGSSPEPSPRQAPQRSAPDAAASGHQGHH